MKVIGEYIRTHFKRSEPLLMVKFPDPPGEPKLRFGFEINRIHPMMSAAEASRAASEILKVIYEERREPSVELSEEPGSFWDSVNFGRSNYRGQYLHDSNNHNFRAVYPGVAG